jgi:hypothetical protein
MGNQMKFVALAAAGAAAVVGLTGCSHTSSSSTASPSTPPPSTLPVTHPTSAADCVKQYNTWRDGGGKGLVAALGAVDSANATGDIQVLSVALKKARPTITRSARYPIPACADSKGYLAVLLMHVNAAASTNSKSTMRAAMKGVPEIERQLTAELKRIA